MFCSFTSSLAYLIMVPQVKRSTNKSSCAWTALVALIFLSKAFKLVHSISNQTTTNFCQNQSKPLACESLPKGIISSTTNLEMQHLWRFSRPQKEKVKNDPPKTLLAMAVGIKQKKIVDKLVKKFSSIDSTVMLFHYDGFVNGWRNLQWIDSALHISAPNQTKWWFAKRFLHPDVVAEYDYIFLWDEELKVDYFNPKRWVEMIAPVFSKAAWRCAWHLIQNDLIHPLEQDLKLGYCTQFRLRSYTELLTFQKTWQTATSKDFCWKDQFTKSTEKLIH